MDITNLLSAQKRHEFRSWLQANSQTANECWVKVKKGKTSQEGLILYLDAVEEALCFGWIDSTVKTADGVTIQRFTPRKAGSNWTELNKERCRRLIKLGLMTPPGMSVIPDLDSKFEIWPEIISEFKSDPQAWFNFNNFHPLYQRVRIDKVQNEKKRGRLDNYRKRLDKLITASKSGKMIGDWNDLGRLLDY